jgi:hypothetical protein
VHCVIRHRVRRKGPWAGNTGRAMRIRNVSEIINNCIRHAARYYEPRTIRLSKDEIYHNFGRFYSVITAQFSQGILSSFKHAPLNFSHNFIVSSFFRNIHSREIVAIRSNVKVR